MGSCNKMKKTVTDNESPVRLRSCTKFADGIIGKVSNERRSADTITQQMLFKYPGTKAWHRINITTKGNGKYLVALAWFVRRVRDGSGRSGLQSQLKMPTSCCIQGCFNVHKKFGHINFFTFPFRNPDLLESWIRAIGRKGFQPTKNSRLCSSHFLPSDVLYRPGSYKARLKPNAVPSIFTDIPRQGSWGPRTSQFRTLDDLERVTQRVRPSPEVELLRQRIALVRKRMQVRDEKLAYLKWVANELKKEKATKLNGSASPEVTLCVPKVEVTDSLEKDSVEC